MTFIQGGVVEGMVEGIFSWRFSWVARFIDDPITIYVLLQKWVKFKGYARLIFYP